jgi:hypothetical protein
MVKQRQAISIVGMAFAVGGGLLWFLGDQYHLVALILWGVAIIVILKLGRRKRR